LDIKSKEILELKQNHDRWTNDYEVLHEHEDNNS
jgi:hypothetical protein